MTDEKVIVGLDIGTSSTRVVVGTAARDGSCMIEAITEKMSEGIKNGSIVNIEQAVKTIRSAVGDGEIQSGEEIKSVFTSIGGEQIKGMKSNGVVGINSKGQEITKDDIKRSLEVARNIQLPQNTEILHTLRQDYVIDGRAGIKSPVDMSGHRLETRVLLVTGSQSIIQNHKKTIEKSGLKVDRIMYNAIVDSEVVLSQEEKEMGAIVINIGAGTTNCVAYSSGAPIFVGGINRGSDLVTSDIAYMFQIPLAVADSLKLTNGCCFSPSASSQEYVTTPPVGGKAPIRIVKKEFAKICEARVAEILIMIQNMLNESDIQGHFGSGVILVGGGALLSGVTELTAEIFRLPCRIGFPEALSGLDRSYIDPRYTTVLGLFKSEAKRYKDSDDSSKRSEKNGFGSRVKSFFGKLF